MVKFTHYLVTRFNVPVENWNRDKAGYATLDDTWMKHRISLFKKYCVPTIAIQSCKNFQWIIYCGDNTSTEDLGEIEAAISGLSMATIRIASGLDNMISDLKTLMSNSTTPYNITSRLDNDDGLGKNYIQVIQDHFKKEDKWLLNPLSGIYYAFNERVMTRMRKSEKNHYTSLIEKNKPQAELKTVLGFPHDDPPSDIRIENIDGSRLWLKIIHEKNVKSLLRGKPVLKMDQVYFDGIDRKEIPVSIINTLKYTFNRMYNKMGL